MNRKEQLAQILAQLSGDMDALTASAAADNRSLTDEEQGKFDKASADFAKAEQEIANINRAEEAKARLALPAPRLTQPMDGATTMAAPSRPGTATITGGTPAARGYAHHGFDKGFGEFLMKVREVATHGRVDPRLMVNAITTWSGESIGADGGYALPPQFLQGIMSLVLAPDSFVRALNPLPTQSDLITIPTDEDAPWAATGVSAAKTAEGGVDEGAGRAEAVRVAFGG